MKTLLGIATGITLLLSISIFGQSGKSVLTQAQKDSINAMIGTYLDTAGVSGSYTLSGVVREVGSDRDYTTIASAITAASSGDVVKIYAGTYSGFTCKDGVNIVGEDKAIISSAITVASGSTVSISNLAVTKIINAGTLTLQDVNLNASTGAYLDMDSGILTANNVNCIGTTTTEPSIDINTGSVNWNARKIVGKVLIDSANVTLNVLDTLRVYTVSGTYQLKVTGNSLVNLNVGTIPYESSYLISANNKSVMSVTIKNLEQGINVYDSAKVYIRNSYGKRGRPYFISGGVNTSISIYNSSFTMSYPDTTSGVHLFETSVPLGGGNFYLYNSSFRFPSFYGDGEFNTGGAPVYIGGASNFEAYNCYFYDGGEGSFYPVMMAFSNNTRFKLHNCTVEYGDANSIIHINYTGSGSGGVWGQIIGGTYTGGDDFIYIDNLLTRPADNDTLIVRDAVFKGSGQIFISERTLLQATTDSAKVDFLLINKDNTSEDFSTVIPKWFGGNVAFDRDVVIGKNYGNPSRYTTEYGNLTASVIKTDGAGKHDGTIDTLWTIDRVTASLFSGIDGLVNTDTVDITLNFGIGMQGKDIFAQSDITLYLTYGGSEQNYTSCYEVKFKGWWDGSGDNYYLAATRLVNDGVMASVSDTSITRVSSTSKQFTFQVPNTGSHRFMYLQAFNNLNIESITMVKR